MKSFNRILVITLVVILAVMIVANLCLLHSEPVSGGKAYRVEIHRIALEIEANGLEQVDLSAYEFVTGVTKFRGNTDEFYHTDQDYFIQEIQGSLYRFDYLRDSATDRTPVLMINLILFLVALLVFAVLIYVRQRIIVPFEKLTDVPYELSKGNLTVPLGESKSRYFGKFVWGIDLLREKLEQQKQRELELQKEKKSLILSLSHDIKTPLSVIKLYTKALSKGLYPEKEKQQRVVESIEDKADEIEGYVSQIVKASGEDFLTLEVNIGEFYLSELLSRISGYYYDKLNLIKTHFAIDPYTDCLLKGDPDRGVEVLQNIIENAIKYGDGGSIALHTYDEDGYRLIAVRNSGCSLPETELPHIFDSFWRGSNAKNRQGSGLGLYICRQLMQQMGGDIFAGITDGFMTVTAVFPRP